MGSAGAEEVMTGGGGGGGAWSWEWPEWEWPEWSATGKEWVEAIKRRIKKCFMLF